MAGHLRREVWLWCPSRVNTVPGRFPLCFTRGLFASCGLLRRALTSMASHITSALGGSPSPSLVADFFRESGTLWALGDSWAALVGMRRPQRARITHLHAASPPALCRVSLGDELALCGVGVSFLSQAPFFLFSFFRGSRTTGRDGGNRVTGVPVTSCRLAKGGASTS